MTVTRFIELERFNLFWSLACSFKTFRNLRMPVNSMGRVYITYEIDVSESNELDLEFQRLTSVKKEKKSSLLSVLIRKIKYVLQ